MKKFFAYLLALCMVLGMLPATALAAGTVYEVDDPATLIQAAVTSQSGDTIKLTGNVQLSRDGLGEDELYYVPSSGKVLDLGGFTLTVPYQTAVFVGDNFTIKNGTIDSAGASYGLWLGYNDSDNTSGVNGVASNVTIDGVTVNGGININNANNVTLKNCTVYADVAGTENDCYAVWAEPYVSNVVIESGTYTAAKGKSAVLTAWESTGVFSIKGGTFTTDPTAYLADGYFVKESNGYTVLAENTAEAKIGDKYYATLAEAISKATSGQTVTLLKDVTTTAITVIDKAITLDGNGKTLTSSAGRAINVSGANGAKIQNLTINASGERAINIIQNATNVTIDSVTATAKNYTVNVAASAPKAVVTIKNSTLNGLCTVNVASAGANVTVTNSTINCNDNDTTEGESYAALNLNKDAVGGKIVATDTTINVTKGSDSEMGRNGAEEGEVTINGSTSGVTVTVAVITYEGSDYYYGFQTLAEAIEFAKAGDTITLIRDVTMSDILVINKAITLDGNGKTLTSSAGRAINVSGANGAKIQNLTINASGERAINIIQNATNVTIDSVTATAKNYTVNVAASAPKAVVTIKNSTLNGLCTVNVASAGANVTVTNSTINCNDNDTTEGESYAALNLNKDAVGGKIVATDTTINVTKGSDSEMGRNGAEEGEVTINGSTSNVTVTVAVITYEGSDYYYGFQTLAEAIEYAKAGDTITLIRNVTEENVTVSKNITLDLNGKTMTGTITLAVGATLTAPEGLTVTSALYTHKVVWAEGKYALEELPVYTVTFHAGGKGSFNGPLTHVVSVPEGKSVHDVLNATNTYVPDPVQEGYTFGKGYTIGDSDFSIATPVNSNIDVYAKWTINQYTVTFNSKNGSSVAAQTVNYGETASKPSNPTRSGYTFKGWYSDEGLTTSYDFSTAVTGDITLYAKWSKNYVAPSKPTTTTETTKNEDGSTTTTVTNNKTGTVTETTENVDGSTTVTETKKDGTSTSTTTGSTTETGEDGSTTKTDSTVTESVAKDGTTTTTETKTETTEAADGSTTKTETKAETKTEADGTETKTETKTETTQNADGTTSTATTETKTETKTEEDGSVVSTETKTETTENADGTTSTATTETKTTSATTTDETTGATVTETKVETKVESEEKTVTSTATETKTEAADGTTETVKVEETVEQTADTTTKTTATTTATEEKTETVAVKEETVTKEDGTTETKTTTTTETALADGTTATATTDESGKTEAQVTLGEQAAASEEPVALPIPPVTSTTESEAASTVTVTTNSTENTKVEIPVAEVSTSTVAVIVNEDGTETVITETKMTEEGLVVDVPDGATVKIVDNSTKFDDVKHDDWEKDAVDFASARGLVKGVGNNQFDRESTATRAQVVTLLARLAGVDTEPGEGENWYDKAHDWAVANGITYEGSMNVAVSRQSMFTMMWLMSGAPKSDHDIGHFTDLDGLTAFAEPAARWAVEVGLVQGYGDGTMNPTGSVTRGELTQFLMNFIQKT